MTIKIITRGVPAHEKIYRATCGSCHSVLDFNVGDAPIKGDQRDSAHVLRCPVCSADCWIGNLKLSPNSPGQPKPKSDYSCNGFLDR